MGINVVLALMVIGSFLVAIPLHESGHALMASMLGDRTPREEGRLSLSLRSHIDPIGTLMCVLLAFQPGLGVGFGWGKPVKADPWKMRVGANAGVLLVAWAGLIFSLLIGVLVSVLLRFVPIQMLESAVGLHVIQLLIVFASVNICLAIFNLFPLYPLDGYQIVYTLLPAGRLCSLPNLRLMDRLSSWLSSFYCLSWPNLRVQASVVSLFFSCRYISG